MPAASRNSRCVFKCLALVSIPSVIQQIPALLGEFQSGTIPTPVSLASGIFPVTQPNSIEWLVITMRSLLSSVTLRRKQNRDLTRKQSYWKSMG